MKALVLARHRAGRLGLAVMFSVLALQAGAQEDARQEGAATELAHPAGVELGRGKASWYGPKFHGRRTSSGERFDMNELTAAHEFLPFGTRVRVRNLANGREVIVRINDRLRHARDRIIDLSKAAAAALGFVRAGEASVVLVEH